ncbi:pyrroloquinoline quinone biosynthesis protein PqqF [Pseudomonas sp. BN606]|nr:pyrroloquinoline quinone biosynthesis protein PqqF [Pseudomonas sp. BN606]
MPGSSRRAAEIMNSRLAAPGPSPLRTRLDNGLELVLLHQPGLGRAAAALRIHAGSHDAPQAFPGLAHFLEHLVFLGSASFPLGQGLIPFVLAQGGDVNATTRERHTDFFFELPRSAFDGGLARLCDMIAAPSLALQSQEREREVLHAEFLAWTHADGRSALPLAASLPRNHPCARFHAGNRYSLPIRQPAFQAALHEHHRQFYRTGQKTLVLAGPQPLHELHWLAQRHAAQLGSAPLLRRASPPALFPLRNGLAPAPSDSELSLAFVLDSLPRDAELTLDFIAFWLAHEGPGSWFGHLRDAGIAERLNIKLSKVGERQAILQLDLQLACPPSADQPDAIALLFSWLEFFAGVQDKDALHDEYARVQLRQLETMRPLALARHWLCNDRQWPGSGRKMLAALPAVLAQLQPAQLVHLRGGHPRAASSPAPQHWQLPPTNRFLGEERWPDVAPDQPPHPGGLQLAPEPPSPSGQGALFLRWRAASARPTQHRLFAMLRTKLAAMIDEARQAGLEIRLTHLQTDWEIAFIGIARVIPSALQAVLEQLEVMPTPPSVSSRARQSSGILIQQMFYRLDQGAEADCEPFSAEALESAWDDFWRSANWDGLAFGLDARTQAQVVAQTRALPGRAFGPLPSNGRNPAELPWTRFETADPQHALLLFCAQPGEDTLTEAIWRALAQLIEPAFFQRMRTELQLGYGVLSGYRRVGGRPGILFGLQSPSTPPEELRRFIEQFLADFPGFLSKLKPLTLRNGIAQLGTQFDDPRQAAEQQWQACKSGQALGLQHLRDAMSLLSTTDLLHGLEDLRQARNEWICMASSKPVEGVPSRG